MVEISSPLQDRVKDQDLATAQDFSEPEKKSHRASPEETLAPSSASLSDYRASRQGYAGETSPSQLGSKRKFSQLTDTKCYSLLSASSWLERTEALRDVEEIHLLYKYEGSAALLNLLSEAKNSISDKNALEFIKGIVSVLPALPLKCDELALVTEAADSLRGLDNEVDSLLSVLTEVVNKPYISDDCSYNNKEFSLQENKKIISSALEHGLSRKLPKIKKILVQNSPSATLRSSLKHSNPDKNSSSGESKRVRFARNEDLVQIRLFEPHPDEISHQQHFHPTKFPKSQAPGRMPPFFHEDPTIPGCLITEVDQLPRAADPEPEYRPALASGAGEGPTLPAGVPVGPQKALPPSLAEPPAFPPPSADLSALMKILPQNDSAPCYPGAELPYQDTVHQPQHGLPQFPQLPHSGSDAADLQYQEPPKERPPDLSPEDLSKLFSLVQNSGKTQPPLAANPVSGPPNPPPNLINSILHKIIDRCAPAPQAPPLPSANHPSPVRPKFRGTQRKSNCREYYVFNPKYHPWPPSFYPTSVSVNLSAISPPANIGALPRPNGGILPPYQRRSAWRTPHTTPPAPAFNPTLDQYHPPPNTAPPHPPYPVTRAAPGSRDRNLPKLGR